MPFRRQDTKRRSSRATAAALALGLAAATLFTAGPADAAATLDAQLTLTGVATGSSPTGGSVIGAHPGDRVTFSTGAIPTAGVPAGLGGLLGGLLGGIAGIQVTITSSSVPGLPLGTMFGGCAAKPVIAKTTPALAEGTYGFSYSIMSVTVVPVLGCTIGASLDLDGNQAAAAKISLNAKNQYVGSVVVAANPPGGGISLQLPSVSVSPNVLGIQLPTVGIPSITTPTIPVTLPTTRPATTATPPGRTRVTTPNPYDYGFPTGGACCGLTADQQAGATTGGSSYVPLAGLAAGSASPPASSTAASASPSATPTKAKAQSFDYGANHAPTGQLPVLLAILAILALSLVSATYARLYLLRRGS